MTCNDGVTGILLDNQQ